MTGRSKRPLQQGTHQIRIPQQTNVAGSNFRRQKVAEDSKRLTLRRVDQQQALTRWAFLAEAEILLAPRQRKLKPLPSRKGMTPGRGSQWRATLTRVQNQGAAFQLAINHGRCRQATANRCL